jgi:nucleotide-binding universal stress UspA family protein
VLLAYPGSPEDADALKVARRMASFAGVHLTILHVENPEDGSARRDALLAEARKGLEAVQVKVVQHASPPDAVLEEAAKGYDLLVFGLQARGGPRRVLAEAAISVLAVHPAGPGGA